MLVQNEGLLAKKASPPDQAISFTLYYNDGSLHLHNNSSEEMPNTPLTFERMDVQGNVVESFEGARWAEFSETTLPDWVGIQLPSM